MNVRAVSLMWLSTRTMVAAAPGLLPVGALRSRVPPSCLMSQGRMSFCLGSCSEVRAAARGWTQDSGPASGFRGGSRGTAR